jgi:hypothetical protein
MSTDGCFAWLRVGVSQDLKASISRLLDWAHDPLELAGVNGTSDALQQTDGRFTRVNERLFNFRHQRLRASRASRVLNLRPGEDRLSADCREMYKRMGPRFGRFFFFLMTTGNPVSWAEGVTDQWPAKINQLLRRQVSPFVFALFPMFFCRLVAFG